MSYINKSYLLKIKCRITYVNQKRGTMENKILALKFGYIYKRFEKEFCKNWDAFIKQCDYNMSAAKQLKIGNHTRPFLVYLGCATYFNFDDSNIIKESAQIAVSIEAIHKASVIIDDIIDGDSLRRGEKCMHREFGEYETIFFAVCMLALGIEKINTFLSANKYETIHTSVISILCDTIYSMCHGALMEISSNIHQQMNLNYIKEIINSETAKLIENSLFIGFLYTESSNEKVGNAIRNIGNKCGYIFQVMNDLEAFCNPQHILAYKGNINSDFLRSRKNIILPYLYNSCNETDKRRLVKLLENGNGHFQEAKELFDKYNIKQIILKELNEIYDSLFLIFSTIKPEIRNQEWIDFFALYLKDTKDKYLSILNIS